MACPAPTATSAAPANVPRDLQSLADVLRARGAVFDAISSPTSSCTSCPVLRMFPSGGRGIATHTHTPKGTTLLRIPYSCIYTCERAKRELGPDDALIAHLADENEGALLAMLLLYYCAHSFGTYAHTHGGTHSGSEPHTGGGPDALSCAYVRTLPPASDFALMCTEWDDAALALVPDSEFVSSCRKQRADLLCEWSHWREWLGGDAAAEPANTADPQMAAARCAREDGVRSSEVAMTEAMASDACEPVATGNGPVKDALRSIASWETYSWARHCVMSRTFVCGLEMDELFMCDGTADLLPIALVPLADMLNHVADEGAAGAAATTDWRQAKPGKEPEACFLVKATRAYGPGEQVCISYGDRPNTELVQTYGFCVPHENNPADAITLPMRVLRAAAAVCASAAPTAVVGDVKSRLFDDYNNPEGVELIDSDAPPSDTLSILRILAIDDEDVRSTSRWSPEMLERPLSRENELRSIRILQHAVAATVRDDLQHRSPGAWDLPHVDSAQVASADADQARTMLQAAIEQDTALRRYFGERARLQSDPGAQVGPPWARRLRNEDAVEQRRAAAAQLRLGRWHILAAALNYCQRMLLVASGLGAPTKVEAATCSAASGTATAAFALEVQDPWSMLLLTGRKSIETRAYALPMELLNVPIALVESPVGGLSVHGLNAGSIIGVVEFDGCAEYGTREAWASATDQHRVPPDAPATAFGWPGVSGAKLFGWHVRRVHHLPRAPLELQEENRVLRSIFRLH